ncbi:uncharacterized protein LOC126108222 [Schistocerca cancellata]|uniref:uncharacterized protein LOC126108222 n=1 Tax=Schistocerca cancellata TaxID=274614 RepID=UPI0021183E40|nr:uncharacterized protein LOC126108222 [Schistocerca cancellata]
MALSTRETEEADRGGRGQGGRAAMRFVDNRGRHGDEGRGQLDRPVVRSVGGTLGVAQRWAPGLAGTTLAAGRDHMALCRRETEEADRGGRGQGGRAAMRFVDNRGRHGDEGRGQLDHPVVRSVGGTLGVAQRWAPGLAGTTLAAGRDHMALCRRETEEADRGGLGQGEIVNDAIEAASKIRAGIPVPWETLALTTMSFFDTTTFWQSRFKIKMFFYEITYKQFVFTICENCLYKLSDSWQNPPLQPLLTDMKINMVTKPPYFSNGVICPPQIKQYSLWCMFCANGSRGGRGGEGRGQLDRPALRSAGGTCGGSAEVGTRNSWHNLPLQLAAGREHMALCTRDGGG